MTFVLQDISIHTRMRKRLQASKPANDDVSACSLHKATMGTHELRCGVIVFQTLYTDTQKPELLKICTSEGIFKSLHFRDRKRHLHVDNVHSAK